MTVTGLAGEPKEWYGEVIVMGEFDWGQGAARAVASPPEPGRRSQSDGSLAQAAPGCQAKTGQNRSRTPFMA